MFRVARDIGCTVAELGKRMSSRELSEWIALYKLEYEERLQAENIARAQANTGKVRSK